jgi:REP element-mobilizing transposase RayT
MRKTRWTVGIVTAWWIEYEGVRYHFLSRGNERRDIFVDVDDRVLFGDTLWECCERFELDVFGYVLMGNHYHLLAYWIWKSRVFDNAEIGKLFGLMTPPSATSFRA